MKEIVRITKLAIFSETCKFGIANLFVSYGIIYYKDIKREPMHF